MLRWLRFVRRLLCVCFGFGHCRSPLTFEMACLIAASSSAGGLPLYASFVQRTQNLTALLAACVRSLRPPAVLACTINEYSPLPPQLAVEQRQDPRSNPMTPHFPAGL
jgi:hypothetical protein